MLQFCQVTAENFEQCIALTVGDDQRDFVDSTAYLIALSKVEPHWQPFALYNAQTLIGFCMYGKDALDVYIIHSIFIDIQFQGQGYGRAAMIQAMARLCELPDCQKIKLDHHPLNYIAARLYSSLGFTYTGEYWSTNEPVMCYGCNPSR